MEKITYLKCITVGDRNVGKSTIYSIFTDGVLHNENVVDYTSAFVIVDKKPIRITLFNWIDDIDLNNSDGMKMPISHLHVDVALICFSLVNLESLENVRTKWFPLVRHHSPKTPIVLVGTKHDLRETVTTSITYKQGKSMAKKIKAVKYLECSALIRNDIQVVMEAAIRTALISSERNNNLRFCKLV